MARIKNGSLKQHEKILIQMLSGKPVTVKEIDDVLGKEIEMYRISAYILGIKYDYKGVIKTAKNGRNVISYQLVNVDEVKKLFETKHPNTVSKIIQVTKLSDLSAKPVERNKEKVQEQLEVTEITVTENV